MCETNRKVVAIYHNMSLQRLLYLPDRRSWERGRRRAQPRLSLRGGVAPLSLRGGAAPEAISSSSGNDPVPAGDCFAALRAARNDRGVLLSLRGGAALLSLRGGVAPEAISPSAETILCPQEIASPRSARLAMTRGSVKVARGMPSVLAQDGRRRAMTKGYRAMQ